MTHITPERITELFKQAFDETRQGDSMAPRFAALLFAEAAAPTVQEPFGWWFTPNGEFLLPTEVEVDNPRDYETYRAMYIDTPPAQPAPVPLTNEQINDIWSAKDNPQHRTTLSPWGLDRIRAIIKAALCTPPAAPVQEPVGTQHGPQHGTQQRTHRSKNFVVFVQKLNQQRKASHDLRTST